MKSIWTSMIIAVIILTSCSQMDEFRKETFVADEEVGQAEYVIKQLKNENIQVFHDLLPKDVSEERKHPITHIVLHFSSNAVLSPEDPYDVEAIRQNFVDYGVSAHYLIGRDGEVYYWVPEDMVAYHAGKGQLEKFPDYTDRLNHYSIGIEIMGIGTKEEMSIMMDGDVYDSIEPSNIGYTDAQYATLETLIDALIEKYPDIKKDRTHIIGHDEYAPDRKTDPGSLFEWEKIGFLNS